MPTPLETVGQLYCENQRLLGEYQKLLGLVVQIKAGDVTPEQVTVDWTAQSWSLAMTARQFAEAISDNGIVNEATPSDPV